MRTVDLESPVALAARQVEESGAQARQAKAALHRAILRHRPPGEIEELEIESAALSLAFEAALRAHLSAVLARAEARAAALGMEAA